MLQKLIKNVPSILLIIIIITLLCSCSDEKNQNDIGPEKNSKVKRFTLADKKIFGIKSGIVEYEITGSQTGTKKLYFDDWGRKQAEFSNSTINVGKYSKHSNILKITMIDWQYIINLENKTGTKRENPVIEKMIELYDQVNYGEFGEQLILIDGGFESGSDNVVGKKCRAYRFNKKKQTWWVWNWILLKSEINRGGIDINIEAVSIQTDLNIPENIFSVPSDVLITEIDLESLRKREQDIPQNP